MNALTKNLGKLHTRKIKTMPNNRPSDLCCIFRKWTWLASFSPSMDVTPSCTFGILSHKSWAMCVFPLPLDMDEFIDINSIDIFPIESICNNDSDWSRDSFELLWLWVLPSILWVNGLIEQGRIPLILGPCFSSRTCVFCFFPWNIEAAPPLFPPTTIFYKMYNHFNWIASNQNLNTGVWSRCEFRVYLVCVMFAKALLLYP